MVIQIDAEPNDTIESCSTLAASVSTLLNVNVKFYFDRVGYYVSPGELAPAVAARIREKISKKPKSKKS